LLIGACAAPVAYPRSAELLEGGRTRVRASGPLVGLADTSAQAVLDSSAHETYSDLSAARVRNGAFPGLDWILGPFLSVEGGFDLSLGVCEIGGLLSFLRVGAELRCGLLQERWGAPFSLAASVAGLYPIDLGGVLFPMRDRGGFRAGFDGSFRLGGWGPLLGAYVDHGTQRRALLDRRMPMSEDLFFKKYSTIVAVRDEWRLAVPLGVALYGERGGGAIAVIVEHTLSARDRVPPVARGDDLGPYISSVTAFEQHWAVFLAGSVAITL
jgi:hypothetical protein